MIMIVIMIMIIVPVLQCLPLRSSYYVHIGLQLSA